MRILTALLVALTITVSASAQTQSRTSGASASAPVAAGGTSGTYHTNSKKVCNCSEQTVTADLCQTSSISVTVGSSSLNVTAGLSTSTCIDDVTLPPGKCAYAVYNVSCTYEGWWSGWDCEVASWSLQPLVDATTVDCPTPGTVGAVR